jgi:hypothetical protein
VKICIEISSSNADLGSDFSARRPLRFLIFALCSACTHWWSFHTISNSRAWHSNV